MSAWIISEKIMIWRYLQGFEVKRMKEEKINLERKTKFIFVSPDRSKRYE